MKRAGFTMIELIFVIVILGILSAVALPKFIGVSEQAKAGKCKALVGTLNRTVLPAIWSDAVLNNVSPISGAFTDANITAQISIPSECGIVTQFSDLIITGTSKKFDMNASSLYEFDINVTASADVSPILTFIRK